MHQGATDASLAVQTDAFGVLAKLTFRSFTDDFAGYLAWSEAWRTRPLAEVLVESARSFVAGLRGRSPDELPDRLRDFRRLDLSAGAGLDVDLPAVFREAGALRLVEDWLAAGDDEALDRAFSWAQALQPDGDWLRAHVLPYLTDPGRRAVEVGGALRALEHADPAWAVPAIVDWLEVHVPHAGDDLAASALFPAGRTLAALGDPAVIPTLIGLIAANPPVRDGLRALGWFGLAELTGVSYDESHDGAWWTAWWERNRDRFGPEVAALPIPTYR